MVIVLLVVLGLCFGSFVNALVWRLHEQEEGTAHKKKTTPKSRRDELSIIRGRSMCVHCKRTLMAADLIPVISWVGLRGKCRYCGKPIAWQYPVVELLVAALLVVSYLVWPYPFDTAGIVQLVLWIFFVAGFVALLVYDLRWMLLPDRIVWPLVTMAVVQAVVLAGLRHDWRSLVGSLLGFVVVGGLFFILFQVSGGRWIGGGDVKLGFCLGVLAGSATSGLLLLFLASTIGSLVSLPLMAVGKAKRNTRIPFGPFLLVAMVITQLFGVAIITWYKRQFLFY